MFKGGGSHASILDSVESFPCPSETKVRGKRVVSVHSVLNYSALGDKYFEISIEVASRVPITGVDSFFLKLANSPDIYSVIRNH